MKISVESDKENDLLYLSIGERALEAGSVAKTVRVSDDIFIDLDKEQRLLGIEVLNASKVVSGDPGKLEIDALIGVKEAAELLGVMKSNFVRDYGDRAGFPEPVAELASGRIWLKSAVEKYAAGRKAKRPSAKATSA